MKTKGNLRKTKEKGRKRESKAPPRKFRMPALSFLSVPVVWASGRHSLVRSLGLSFSVGRQSAAVGSQPLCSVGGRQSKQKVSCTGPSAIR